MSEMKLSKVQKEILGALREGQHINIYEHGRFRLSGNNRVIHYTTVRALRRELLIAEYRSGNYDLTAWGKERIHAIQ